jgi:glutathione S-transferase
MMKLAFSATSPYARKVLLLAIELGLHGRIQREAVALSPYEPHPGVVELNPLGKVPVLVTDDGFVLFDSTVACEYLSALAGDATWFPPAGPARWHALRCNALANGLLEAGTLVRLEQGRPEEFRYGKWVDAQAEKVNRALGFLEEHLPAHADIGAIATACALGWLDLRLRDLGWRQRAPRLADWFQAFSRRESFTATRHPHQ